VRKPAIHAGVLQEMDPQRGPLRGGHRSGALLPKTLQDAREEPLLCHPLELGPRHGLKTRRADEWDDKRDRRPYLADVQQGEQQENRVDGIQDVQLAI